MKFFPLILLTLLSCKTNNKMPPSEKEKETIFIPQFTPGPPVLVYKTKTDYTNYVPVILSDDKTRIISYPDPKDIQNSAPVKLKNGYLLDNRGISKNAAFLNWTYAKYSKLPATLSQE